MSYVNQFYTKYRVASSLAGLATGHFFVGNRLDQPQRVFFRPYSVQRLQRRGGEVRHGFSQTSLLWKDLLAPQVNFLWELITAVEVTDGVGNGTLFFTVPRVDASSSGVSWIDISGIVIMPDFQISDFSHGLIYTNILLKLNDVTIENEPSTVL